MASHGGRVPRTSAALRALPGVGPYTAAAIASQAYHEPVGVVDGNVARVLSRHRAVAADIKSPRGAAVLQAASTALAAATPPPFSPGDLNQALMELGALVCHPRAPLCGECPIQTSCAARALAANNATTTAAAAAATSTPPKASCPLCVPVNSVAGDAVWAALPCIAPKKAPLREAYVAVLLVSLDADLPRFWLQQRPSDGLLANMWTFPHALLADGGGGGGGSSVPPAEAAAAALLAAWAPGPPPPIEWLPRPVAHVFSHRHHTYTVGRVLLPPGAPLVAQLAPFGSVICVY